jgi:hypothetical protein
MYLFPAHLLAEIFVSETDLPLPGDNPHLTGRRQPPKMVEYQLVTPTLTDVDRFMVSLSNHEASYNRAGERLHGSTSV